MLLVEKSVSQKLFLKSFNEKVSQRGTISEEEFREYKGEFDKLMDDNGHAEDKEKQYFQQAAFQNLLSIPSVKKVAFVFLSEPKGHSNPKRLSVAMLGLDCDHNFIYVSENGGSESAYRSERNSIGNNPPLKVNKNEVERMIKNHLERREKEDKLKVLQSCDKGIWHSRKDVEEFLKSVNKSAELHFGIQHYYFQVVMLIGDISVNASSLVHTADYAFDRGNGCCPEQ